MDNAHVCWNSRGTNPGEVVVARKLNSTLSHNDLARQRRQKIGIFLPDFNVHCGRTAARSLVEVSKLARPRRHVPGPNEVDLRATW